jgi:ferredoxin-thioredoxin reductase catalytic subunit
MCTVISQNYRECHSNTSAHLSVRTTENAAQTHTCTVISQNYKECHSTTYVHSYQSELQRMPLNHIRAQLSVRTTQNATQTHTCTVISHNYRECHSTTYVLSYQSELQRMPLKHRIWTILLNHLAGSLINLQLRDSSSWLLVRLTVFPLHCTPSYTYHWHICLYRYYSKTKSCAKS